LKISKTFSELGQLAENLIEDQEKEKDRPQSYARDVVDYPLSIPGGSDFPHDTDDV